LKKEHIYFFQQGAMPSVDINSGRLLMEAPGRIFSSPNGHGGCLTALADSGLLADMRERGIRSLFYFQVDNPLVRIADPAFVGRHVNMKSEVSSKAIAKAYPKEKMGVLASVNGRCCIIEYSDMPEELLVACDTHGELQHRAGSPAIHVFDVDFLTRVTSSATAMPYHIARKKVAHIDEQGNPVAPVKENALKFELFIFDVLPLAERYLVLEAPRHHEFAPVKNADGVDSPETSKQALMNLAGEWLEFAGIGAPRDDGNNVATPVEISPTFALDAAELAARVRPGRSITGPTYLE
jgi:UDP-N-acetylglucosamine/UDP-N-acetylgalactosamine diphosphorylase